MASAVMPGDAPAAVRMKLELVVLPVTDVDRAKAFYSRLGWHCKSYASYASFSDPDGNTWVMQEITAYFGPDLRPGDARFTHQLVNAALGLSN